MFINPPSNSPRAGRRARGASPSAFTLIEVVIGLTLLSMITVTLFAIIRGSVQSAAEIERTQRESDSVNRFIELSRRAFASLPATATLSLKLVQTTEPVIQELTIAGSPDCFPAGAHPITFKDTILRLRPHPDEITDDAGMPIHYLSLSREDLIPENDPQNGIRQETTGIYAPDEEGRYWMPLLPDVIAFKWRFYVEKDKTWYEEWEKTEWPDLIEGSLTLKNRTQPIRMVFGVPVITITAGREPSGTSSSSSSNTSNTSGPTAAGGGGGGAPGGGGGRGGDGGGGGPRGGGGGPPGGGGDGRPQGGGN
jgi:type II secretory pathway pseudopilin PulG